MHPYADTTKLFGNYWLPGIHDQSPLNEKKLTAISGMSSGKGAVCPSMFSQLLTRTPFFNQIGSDYVDIPDLWILYCVGFC